jgi:hypothetical protein
MVTGIANAADSNRSVVSVAADQVHGSLSDYWEFYNFDLEKALLTGSELLAISSPGPSAVSCHRRGGLHKKTGTCRDNYTGA